MEFTIDKFTKEVAEKALDEITYEGKTIREWVEILAKQQPCEDCISRQAVLDIITFEDKWLFDANGHNANTHIAFSGLESRVKALPSVKPERPKGKWIRVVDKAGHWVWECDCKWQQRFATNFCPNCGSYNAENKENEDD